MNATYQTLDEPGLRYDGGKLRLDLVPLDAVRAVAEVATFGAGKYAPRNWEKGMSWSRIWASMFRHFLELCGGERLDKETGLPHSAHIAWGALALCAYDLRQAGGNDLGDLVGILRHEREDGP